MTEQATQHLEAPDSGPTNGSVTPHRRAPSAVDAAIALGLAAVLSVFAFVAGGGLQLGSMTFVEAVSIVLSAAVIAAAVLLVGFKARINGAVALAGLAGLAAVTAFSITWSLFPNASWLEANRTVAYVGVFAAGIASVRLARDRWPAVLAGLLAMLGVVTLYGLATKVAPGLLDPDEIYARLRAPYDYWNAVGLTAALGVPLCMWLGTREQVADWVSALAYPLMGVFIVSILMSYSRGSILAAAIGAALWLIFVPHRLRSLIVLALPSLVGGVIAAWAFSQSALADDNVSLSSREDYGLYFGAMLIAAMALLFFAGLLIAKRARTKPLSEQGRKRANVVAACVLGVLAIVGLGLIGTTGGGFSGRLHDLTHEPGTPSNDSNRLAEAGSVRTVYYHRALKIFEEREFKGSGAGSFGTAQLRYRTNAAQAQHAHGYIHQTLADLGLLGLGVSLLAMFAWFVAATKTIGMRRGRWRTAWTEQRAAMAALIVVATVFGVHSALDWTWYVPALAIAALFVAGWVAGRGAIGSTEPSREDGPLPLDAVDAAKPPRNVLLRRLPVAVGVVAAGVLGVLVVLQPWMAQQKSEDALRYASDGNLAQAREAVQQSKEINPFSTDPYFELAAIETAADNNSAALRALQFGVQREPANPATWNRLGSFYLNEMNQPERAIPVLRAAVYLDPYSVTTQNLLVTAIRAQRIKQQAAAAKAARRAAAALAAGKPTAVLPSTQIPIPIPGQPSATAAGTSP